MVMFAQEAKENDGGVDDDLEIIEDGIDTDKSQEEEEEEGERRSQEKPSSNRKGKRKPSSKKGVPPPTSWSSKVRNTIRPYLPPPVLHGMDLIDPVLQPYMGPDGTFTVTTTILVACWVLYIVRGFSSRIISSRGGGKAIADDEDDDIMNNQLLMQQQQSVLEESYGATVLLCGPVDGGKTRIFYELCHNQKDVPTLSSIRANIGVSSSRKGPEDSLANEDGDDNHDENECVRYIDWPGHAPLSDPLLQPVFDEALQSPGSRTVRLVLILDSAQPMAQAAYVLDQLFSILYTGHKQKNKNNTKRQDASASSVVPSIFIACHKQDMTKSKNAKRVKIQLRTELERLLKAQTSTTSTATANDDETQQQHQPWWPPGEPLELDQLEFCQIYFGPTSCVKQDHTWCTFVEYCKTGKLPSL